MTKKLVLILLVTMMAMFSACGPCRRSPVEAPADVEMSVDLSLTDTTTRLRRDSATGASAYAGEAIDLELLLPATWAPERLRVEEGDGPAAQTLHPNAARALRFSYNPDDEHLDATPLLLLLGFARDEWPRARQVQDAPTGSVLKETDTEIVIAVTAAANPYPPDSVDHDWFQKAVDMTPLALESARGKGEDKADAAPARVAGVYTGTLPAADASERVMRLTLRQDGAAEMRTEYVGKGEVIENGRWTRAADIVAVTLSRDDGAGETTLSWTRANGNLIPRRWDESLYGEMGVPLTYLAD